MRFGTDGLRGPANSELTPELAMALGRAAARTIDASVWYVARDTRRSGPMLAAALAAGLASEGCDVCDLGVAPTPVAADAARAGGASVVVSASHNPWPDNGLKVFAPGGRKLSDAEQASIERLLVPGALDTAERSSLEVGTVDVVAAPIDAYLDRIAAAVDGRRLDGLRVVVDCGHGAAVRTAAPAFNALGADAVLIHDQPDGRNINDGVGSTDTARLAATVREQGARLGVAFDGDADRLIAIDERGDEVDGDRLLAMFAIDLAAQGRLASGTLVVTVMSNLGLHRAMRDAGIDVAVTPVGDRHVLEAMADGSFSLGGEQSGHLVFADHATTGDGLLAALLLCDLVVRDGRPLSVMASSVLERVPQLLVNVRTAVRPDDPAGDLAELIAGAETELGDEGRVLVRASGTEPLVRVMVEAADVQQAQRLADEISAAVLVRYGAPDG